MVCLPDISFGLWPATVIYYRKINKYSKSNLTSHPIYTLCIYSVRLVPVSEVRAMDRVKRQFSTLLGDSEISSGSLFFISVSFSSVFSGSGSYDITQPWVIYKLHYAIKYYHHHNRNGRVWIKAGVLWLLFERVNENHSRKFSPQIGWFQVQGWFQWVVRPSFVVHQP